MHRLEYGVLVAVEELFCEGTLALVFVFDEGRFGFSCFREGDAAVLNLVLDIAFELAAAFFDTFVVRGPEDVGVRGVPLNGGFYFGVIAD